MTTKQKTLGVGIVFVAIILVNCALFIAANGWATAWLCFLAAVVDGREQCDDQPYRLLIFVSAGLLVAFVVGQVVVAWFLRRYRLRYNVPPKRKGALAGALTGFFERALAFGLVLVGVQGTYVILIAWMGAKLALNWERPVTDPTPERERVHRVYGFTALMGGTLSLIIAVIGGLIARCGL